MESNVVMTLDKSGWKDSSYAALPYAYTEKYNLKRTTPNSDDGAWNDVAESTLHHTVCEFTNKNVKGNG